MNIILKMLVVISGAACVAIVYVVDQFKGIFQLAFVVTGVTNGPLLGLFTLGMLFPNINSTVRIYLNVPNCFLTEKIMC